MGRRKSSVARVRIWDNGSGKFTINGEDHTKYLPTEDLITAANGPLRKLKMLEKFEVSVIVNGGGSRGQAEAIRHGLARAVVKYDAEMRLRLKKSGFLKRDPREKERKKYGLKKARKAPQWSKR
ncbi:MAG: 30S ribosomal protein S9 [Candidatus Spechtbacterales bacterium]